MRLMPCMYLTNVVLGRSGSGWRKYKYSAICLSTPIKKLYHKDTVFNKFHCLKNFELWRRAASGTLGFFAPLASYIKTVG